MSEVKEEVIKLNFFYESKHDGSEIQMNFIFIQLLEKEVPTKKV